MAETVNGARPDSTATESAPLLEARQVTKKFGGLTAVADVDFTIPERAIVSLIGPNGAGKTTFFNIMTGLYVPTSGALTFAGARLMGGGRTKWSNLVSAGPFRTFASSAT